MEVDGIRALIDRASLSLDAAVTCVMEDQEAALDDMLAARLLLSTALAAMNGSQDP